MVAISSVYLYGNRRHYVGPCVCGMLMEELVAVSRVYGAHFYLFLTL